MEIRPECRRSIFRQFQDILEVQHRNARPVEKFGQVEGIPAPQDAQVQVVGLLPYRFVQETRTPLDVFHFLQTVLDGDGHHGGDAAQEGFRDRMRFIPGVGFFSRSEIRGWSRSRQAPPRPSCGK